MAPARPKKSSLLFFAPSLHKRVQELLKVLDTETHVAQSEIEFVTLMGSNRHIGCCLALKTSELHSYTTLLAQMDSMAMLEGLRPVLLFEPESKDVGSIPWFQTYPVTFFRDLISLNDLNDPKQRQVLLERIYFATNLATKSPFAAAFDQMAKEQLDVECEIPARISWNEGTALLVESGVYITEGTSIAVRLQLSAETHYLHARVEANAPDALRYNYGNSVKLRLAPQSAALLQGIIGRIKSTDILATSLRRAFVVTKSVQLRQQLIQTLSKNDIESRIPLVKRNILSDLPLLQPHLVIVEDRLLSELCEKNGPKFISELIENAGPQARIFVLGNQLPSEALNHPSFQVLSDRVESYQAQLMIEIQHQLEEGSKDLSASNRKWFSNHSKAAGITLILREKMAYVAPRGFVIRSANQYRLWKNIVVTVPEIQFKTVVKPARSFIITDAFRGYQNKMFSLQESNTLTFLASLLPTPGLAKLYESALGQSIRSTNTLGSLLHLAQAESASEVDIQEFDPPAQKKPLPLKVLREEEPSETVLPPKQHHRPFKIAPAKRVHSAAASAEKFDQRARAYKQTAQDKNQFYLYTLIFLVIVTLLVMTSVMFGEQDGSHYSGSFKKLFDTYKTEQDAGSTQTPAQP